MRIKTHLGNVLYLSSLQSALNTLILGISENRFSQQKRQLVLLIDYHWYITTTKNTENIAGAIRSVVSGPIIYPEVEWEYLRIEITECNTTASTQW